jgi:hypothetical protein
VEQNCKFPRVKNLAFGGNKLLDLRALSNYKFGKKKYSRKKQIESTQGTTL